MPQRRNSKKSSRLLKYMGTLVNLKKLPSNKDVLQRRGQLQNENMGKPKSVFLSKLAKEIEDTWTKQDVPVQSWPAIYNKLQRCKLHEDSNLFDCLPNKPVWKTKEDKEYYLNQKQNLGGYCTSKEISYKIHPSKRPVARNVEQTTSEKNVVLVEDSNLENISDQDSNQDDATFNPVNQLLRIGDVKFAELLRERANLSISQTVAVMQFYKDQFPDLHSIPTPPSRSSLSRASRKAAEKISNDVTLNAGSHTLYFDMKQYTNLYGKKREMICVCVGNKLVEFQELRGKKAATIVECLLPIVNKWHIDTIVSDTEPTNTGNKNGVIALINKSIPNIAYEPCRLHVLDLILKHEMQHFLGKTETSSPNIPYTFVTKLQENWNYYRSEYYKVERSAVEAFPDLPKNEDRRDDYSYLLELTKAVRTLNDSGERRYVKIPCKKISISSARWNSKAIYSLMAELVMESKDEHLVSLNRFIVYQWAPVWFGVRDVADWGKLRNVSDGADKILLKHGLKNKTECKPPTNEFAERIFRQANEKISRCSSVQFLRNALLQYVNNSIKLN